MKYDGEKLEKSGEEVRVDTNLVISSIGSIPEPLSEIPMEWETYDISDTVTGAVNKYEGVYGVGNAVTGKGNIMVSNRHAKNMGSFVASSLNNENKEEVAQSWEKETQEIANKMQEIYEYLSNKPGVSDEDCTKIMNFVRDLNKRVDYDNYNSWKESILAQRN